MKQSHLLLISAATLLFFSTNASAEDVVKLKRMVPTKYHIEGIKKVAVAPFTYTVTYHEKGATAIPKLIRHEIREKGPFEVIEDVQFERPLMDKKHNIPKLIQAGRRAGAGAIITGEVTAFQVDIESCGGAQNAEVSFCVDIINVGKNKITDHYCYSGKSGKLAKIKGPTEEKMKIGTAKAVVEKFAASLMSHEVVDKIPFKHGRPCDRGIKLAKKERWDEASWVWTGALTNDANCDCALYNLGLAREVHGGYAEALSYYEKASRLMPEEKLYNDGISRVTKKSGHEKRLKK